MQSRGNLKRAIAAVVAGVLIGGGITAVSPAGAEVSHFAATNWKKIWKKKLQPRADKRYYTKSASDAKYIAAGSAYSKAEVEAKLSGYYTKAQSDAAYAPKAQTYTKTESDAKYAPYPSLIKGTYFMTTTAAAGAQVGADISFGYTIPAAPTVHYIPQGAAPPADCSGTVEAPDASVGHLCAFEQLDNNASGQQIYNASGAPGVGSRMGALLNATATAAGDVFVYGSWAVRPGPGAVSGTGALKAPDATAPAPTLGR